MPMNITSSVASACAGVAVGLVLNEWRHRLLNKRPQLERKRSSLATDALRSRTATDPPDDKLEKHRSTVRASVGLDSFSHAELQIWKKLDRDGDGKISEKDFVQTCIDEFRIDLSEVELLRLFKRGDRDASHFWDEAQFLSAVRSGACFRNVMVFAEDDNFQVPNGYDFERTTNDNYRSGHLDFYGSYADIRENLDYSYHVNYTEERQRWQDHVIDQVVMRTCAHKFPWVIFTCGPMGAGKGFALSWMSSRGFFPLEGMVHIDPDYFKSRMPEFKKYSDKGKEAGTMCHRESTFMQEIAQEAAMRKRQNVWIDGSLKDTDWFGHVFDEIRRIYPQYRIAIMYVWASEERVRQRCKDRARITGRDIPEELIKASLQDPKESLATLIPKADFIARIDNNHQTPLLEAVEIVDRSGCWSTIQERFAKQCAQGHEFPNYLNTLALRTVPADLHKCLCLMLQNCATSSTMDAQMSMSVQPSLQMDGHHSYHSMGAQQGTCFLVDVTTLDDQIQKVWQKEWDGMECTLFGSPVHAVATDTLVRETQEICDEAVCCAWVNCLVQPEGNEAGPQDDLPTSWASARIPDGRQDSDSSPTRHVNKNRSIKSPKPGVPNNALDFGTAWMSAHLPKTPSDQGKSGHSRADHVNDCVKSLASVLLHGCFVYFNEKHEVVQIQTHAHYSCNVGQFQFGPRVDLEDDVVVELAVNKRWATPRLEFFTKRGVKGYAWCAPYEVIAGTVIPHLGAFAFLLENDHGIYFPVIS